MKLLINKFIGRKSIILLLVMTALFLAFIFSLKDYKNSSQKYLNKKTELDANLSKLRELEAFKKNPGELNEIYESIQKLLPDNEGISDFIVQTENLAVANNLVIENFSITKPAAKASGEKTEEKSTAQKTASKLPDKVKSTAFSFSTKTSYKSVLSLLIGMESLDRFNQITSFSISASEKEDANLNLNGEIYYEGK